MAYNTIVLKTWGPRRRKERLAAAALSPGHLLEVTSADKVQKVATAGKASRLIAVEDDIQGNGISDAYASGARVQYEVLLPGDEALVTLKDGETIVIGDLLTSAAGGLVQKILPDSSGVIVEQQACFRALAALDLSGSSGVDPSALLLVEAL